METDTNVSHDTFSAASIDPPVNVHESRTTFSNVLLLGGSVVSVLAAPVLCYKLITTPSPIYEQNPKLWRNLVVLCVGLTFAGGSVIQQATERAYGNSLTVSTSLCRLADYRGGRNPNREGNGMLDHHLL